MASTVCLPLADGKASDLPPPPEHAYLSFLEENVVAFPGNTAEKSFFLRLPEHVRYREGCKLVLTLHGTEALLGDLCSLSILINGAGVFNGPSGYELSTNRTSIALVLPVPPNHLVADWNRISLVFHLQKPFETAGLSRPESNWEMRRSESFFDFAFERVPLFPELRRFPLSMAEEELLQAGLVASRTSEPAVAILIPDLRRDIYARALAVLGATLGKPGYLNACRLGRVSEWNEIANERHGILVARKDELQDSVLPEHVRNQLDRLSVDEGLLAEIITGPVTNQHRWIIVSGADDPGVEKALLTLSHAPALLAAPPNPAIIRSQPLVAGPLEEEALPGPATIPLRTPRQPHLHFRGIYESEQTFTSWRLPPGYKTGPGSLLNLLFTHSTALTEAESYFEILANGVPVGLVNLDPENATNGTIQISLPSGLRGYETMSLTFRAHLDLPSAQCEPPATREAWLTISGDSFIESVPDKMEGQDLRQLQALILRDLFLRKTAFLLPAGATPEEMQWFLDFCLQLGQQLSSSPILWPEALFYEAEERPPEARLQNKTVILFGSLAQVSRALPEDVHPLMEIDPDEPNYLQVQGGAYALGRFEESMGILMLLDSPWSNEDKLIAAGGFQTFALPALHRMMHDEKSAGKKYGVVSAMDAQGRWMGYDPAKGTEPLVDAFMNRIPAGLSLEQTLQRERERESRSRWLYQFNFAVMVWTGVLLLLLIACRVWLMWERMHLHRKKSSNSPPRSRAAP